MLNIKFKKRVLLASMLLLQPIANTGSFAWAKKRSPAKYFSFIAEGGKASQGECDGERKIPRKLKHQKEYAKASSYMGSELEVSELKTKNNEEMWKHFFRSKDSCNTVLAKTPSSVDSALTNNKVELPPEDSTEPDSEDPPEGAPESPDSE